MSVNYADRSKPNSNGPGTDRQSELGVGLVFGIIAGGALGLISGLAQYNAIFVGSPGAFVLPAIMTLGGGGLGSAVGAALGLLGDNLVGRWKHWRARPVAERELPHAGGGNVLARSRSASGRPAA